MVNSAGRGSGQVHGLELEENDTCLGFSWENGKSN